MDMPPKGQMQSYKGAPTRHTSGVENDFVLEKNIFSSIFDKDIRRVFIYKKAERLAKAIHLITPAFQNAPALRERIAAIAVSLVDAATLPPVIARETFSRDLLALSSVLSIARTAGMLSNMNSELIAKEARTLLQEVATYEEPQLSLGEVPSLSELSKTASRTALRAGRTRPQALVAGTKAGESHREHIGKKTAALRRGHIKDISVKDTRRDAILSVIRTKENTYIKDISTAIRDVSEKTIQRELAAMVIEGVLIKKGERRWTSYSLAS